MLILMRRQEESIIIGDNIKLKVLKIQGNQVHIGIEAPREIKVYRKEIYDKICHDSECSDAAICTIPMRDGYNIKTCDKHMIKFRGK